MEKKIYFLRLHNTFEEHAGRMFDISIRKFPSDKIETNFIQAKEENVGKQKTQDQNKTTTSKKRKKMEEKEWNQDQKHPFLGTMSQSRWI